MCQETKTEINRENISQSDFLINQKDKRQKKSRCSWKIKLYRHGNVRPIYLQVTARQIVKVLTTYSINLMIINDVTIATQDISSHHCYWLSMSLY